MAACGLISMVSSLPGSLFSVARFVLLIAIVLLVYTWAVFPAALWILKRKFARPLAPAVGKTTPLVSIIIAVHNEEQRIRAKLENCLQLDYPRERLEVIVASDGSTDSTEGIVGAFTARYPHIGFLGVERGGKSNAQNAAAQKARGEILLFTDVDTMCGRNLLELLTRNFQDSDVGMVTATVHFVRADGAVSKGQGLYWRYELFLRAAESAIGVLATGSGQALAVRRSLFRAMPAFYGDDCVLPLDIRLQGYRVVQDNEAVVFDTMPNSVEGELRARARMTARNWTGTLSRLHILNLFRFPLTACALVSHKVLRWLTPIFLLAVLVCNALLLLRSQYVLLGILQALFYAAALVGWLRTRKARHAGLCGYPFSFCLANVGFFLGLVLAVRNEKITAYQQSR